MKCPVVTGDHHRSGAAATSSSADDELRLVGDLASAQVGRPKGFSIDAPSNVDCEVLVTGKFDCRRLHSGVASLFFVVVVLLFVR